MKKPNNTKNWNLFYQLAEQLFVLEPWEWMFDVDLFGVQDLESGQIGYCGFLGAGNGVKGFALFRGSSGLFSFERLIEQNPETLQFLESYQLDGLMLTFQEVELLGKEELDFLRKTGYEFSGKPIVPILKDHVPGMMPWKVVEESMVERMVLSLEQALLLGSRFKDNPDLLDDTAGHPGRILVKIPQIENDKLVWSEAWLTEPNLLAEVYTRKGNDLFLRSRCSGMPTLQDDWVADVFYFPQPVKIDQERPYLPQMVLLISSSRREIIASSKYQPGELDMGIDKLFVEVAEKEGGLPHALITNRPESYGYWLPVAQALGIEIQLRTDEMIIDDLKGNVFSSFAI